MYNYAHGTSLIYESDYDDLKKNFKTNDSNWKILDVKKLKQIKKKLVFNFNF